MSKDRLEEIEERLAKASPGPWQMQVDAWCNFLLIPECREIRMVLLDDTKLIVNAPEDIKYLLSLARSAQKLEKALEGVMRDIENGDGIRVNLIQEALDNWSQNADK